MDSSVAPSLPKTPQLTPVFLINLKLGGFPVPIYGDSVKDKLMVLAHVEKGEITTVENSLGLEFNVTDIHGFDDITNQKSQDINELDCKLYGKTPEGAGVYITYYGLIKLFKNTVDVLTKQSMSCPFEESYVTSNPRVTLDELADEKYRWVTKENLLGKGRFVRGPNDSLYVQYYVYVVR
ncbi:hypothetical protein PUMCH_003327 [Australozyma saopauloensis]|uniref:Uncharacterized protein n=1 Tax=Australozyma saopauloensis TaxID=291208 RepID=A0AAX4HC14_9ASCO|nr:hypothetical protein PUMCH_003327 [[Candida] saopauloensis]